MFALTHQAVSGFDLLRVQEGKGARIGRRRYRLRRVIAGVIVPTLVWAGVTWPLWGGALRLLLWLQEPMAAP